MVGVVDVIIKNKLKRNNTLLAENNLNVNPLLYILFVYIYQNQNYGIPTRLRMNTLQYGGVMIGNWLTEKLNNEF